MRNILILLSLLTCSSACAITTEALSLFTGKELNDVPATYRYDTPGEQLIVTPDRFLDDGMQVTRIDLRFQRKMFASTDWATVNRLVWDVASHCMNLSPERRLPLLNWIAAHNTLGKGKWLTTFGPMTVRFERFVDADGVPQSVIGLGRGGQPGQKPWVNFCQDTSGAG